MQIADAEAVARLSGQLGYPTERAQVGRRMDVLAGDSRHGLFVAQIGDTVVGWVHVYGVASLASDGYAEIGGLVVHIGARMQGLGRALMRAAEGWARAGGYPEVRLRSGLHRMGAHQFYQRIGYALTKTSHMFSRPLSPGETSP